MEIQPFLPDEVSLILLSHCFCLYLVLFKCIIIQAKKLIFIKFVAIIIV